MAMRAALTDEKIAALRPAAPGVRYHVYDADEAVPGFGVRVTEAGPTSFLLYTRFAPGAPPARTTLGKVGAMKVVQARHKAEQWLSMLKAGLDPRAEERQRREEARKLKTEAKKERQDLTFKGMAAAFVQFKRRAGHRRVDVAEREIERHLVSRWGKRQAADIKRSDVVDMVEALLTEGKARTAHDMLAHARAIFTWAINQGRYGLDSSPCDRIKPARLIGEKKIRSRVLDDAELAAYWRAASRLPYPIGPFYKVLLLTGQRLNEVAGMRWRELHPDLVKWLRSDDKIDWSAVPDAIKVWTVPPERFKSNVEHKVRLTNAVCEVLATVPLFKGGDHVFTSTFGKKPINGFTQAKAWMDRRMLLSLRAAARRAGGEPRKVSLAAWVQHDVRRTVRTRLSELRIAHEVAELVIGHGRKGIARNYDHHQYEIEMREALEAWANRLLSIAEPNVGNVVRLPVREARR